MATPLPDEASTDQAASASTSRLLVLALVLLAIVVVGYFALGMPGMDHGPAPEVKHEQMDM